MNFHFNERIMKKLPYENLSLLKQLVHLEYNGGVCIQCRFEKVDLIVFKTIEETYSICPLIFRHCDFP